MAEADELGDLRWRRGGWLGVQRALVGSVGDGDGEV
jgi:hypothetical protein